MARQQPRGAAIWQAWQFTLVGVVLGLLFSVAGLVLADGKTVSFGLLWAAGHVVASGVFYLVGRRQRSR